MFIFFNQTIVNPVFDAVLPLWRDAKLWTPLYVIILIVAIKEHKKKAWLWFLFGIITVVITDQCSSHLIKPLVQRLRPYDEPIFKETVRLLVSKIGRGYSFTSSHATNHFGIAVFFIGSLISIKKYKYLIYAWAAIVCLAQVYVGVHYPIDVLCGAFLGYILGKISLKMFQIANEKVFFK